jgi:hypothetical protein
LRFPELYQTCSRYGSTSWFFTISPRIEVASR